MKYKIISAVAALSLTIAVFTSCGAQNSVPESKGGFELQLTQPDVSDTTSEVGKITSVRVSASRLPPDLHRTLAMSELIISGEVIKELEPYHTNPDNDDIMNHVGERIISAMVNPYLVRVNEVYKGNATPGDTIVINAMNDRYLPYNAKENGSVKSDLSNIYLDIGQKSLFCLAFDAWAFSADKTVNDVGYSILSNDNGVFEAKTENSEQATAANAAEEHGTLLYSKELTIDLNTLADEIEEADRIYEVDINGIRYKNKDSVN